MNLPKIKTPPTRAQSVQAILHDVSAANSVLIKDIIGPSRVQHIVAARAEAMQRMRFELLMTTPQIGKIFNRDHSTVCHAIKKCGMFVELDRSTMAQIEAADMPGCDTKEKIRTLIVWGMEGLK